MRMETGASIRLAPVRVGEPGKLEHAWSAETKVLALDIDDGEALLRAMEDWCPPELGELRAVLLREHVGRVRDGLV